jgi:hypothetical protein
MSTRRLQALLVVRLLLLANGCVLGAIAALYLVFGERPAGLVVGGVLGAVAAGLFACVPLTNPDRHR